MNSATSPLQRSSSDKPLVLLSLVSSIALSLTLFGCGGAGSTTHAAQQRRGEGAVPVVVATVTLRDVPIDIQVIGNVEAYSTISVKALVGGQLMEAYFKEGDYVKKGDRLFTIDERPLQGQLNQAEANLLHDVAALSQAEANLARDNAQERYAQTQAARYEALFKEGVMSRDQTDQIRSNADALAQAVNADKAAIESAKAQVVAAKSSVENAKVQLGYTSIFSPIDGRTGNLAVKQGNIVAANTMDLMTINEVEPIYVTFSVPEANLPEIKRFMADGKLPVIAMPQSDASKQETGVLTFIDNAVDMTTGTIKLKGTFENKDRALWPGEYVRVTLRLRTQPNALVLPNQAVQTGQEGQFVYVVKADKTVEFRPVVTGARIDQDLVIEKGVRPGETVVTEGQLRLAPGTHVQLPGDRPKPGQGAPRTGPAA